MTLLTMPIPNTNQTQERGRGLSLGLCKPMLHLLWYTSLHLSLEIESSNTAGVAKLASCDSRILGGNNRQEPCLIHYPFCNCIFSVAMLSKESKYKYYSRGFKTGWEECKTVKIIG
jgi:hypothetical protein